MQTAMILALSLYLTWSAGYLALCFHAKKAWVSITLAVIGVPAIYFAHMLTLVLYFELAMWFARSESEIDAIVGGDGAKLIFHGLIVAPLCSLVIVCTGVMLHGIGVAVKQNR